MTTSIVAIDTPSLGDRSYLVHDGRVAFVVDPQRDIDRMLAAADGAGVRITHVFETHIHNDYVTGGFALAQQTGAQYLVNTADAVSFDRTPISGGDVVEVSPELRVRVVATPGHTFTHLSYVLEGEDPAVFSGGSLLFGSTGRPDLLGPEHTHTLAHHQFASARPRAARRHGRHAHARVRQLLLGHRHDVRRHRVDDRDGAAQQPRPDHSDHAADAGLVLVSEHVVTD